MKQRTRSSSSSPRWLSLSQAARILGIHPTTLRRWTDEGAIRCLRTPGGHRRFQQRDLDAFLEAQTEAPHSEPADMLARSMVQQTRREMETSQVAGTPWHAAFSEAERAARRESGRRLLGLAIQFTSRTTGREGVLDEARCIGREYGRDAAERGLSLVETSQALMFFRAALISAARPGLSTQGNYDTEDIRIHRSLRQFLDQVFFAAMAGFEKHVQAQLLERAE
jgi:excisionase family DNA binding protein